MSTQNKGRQLPTWVLPVAIGVGVLVLALSIWKAMSGSSNPEAPTLQVRPGMIDGRTELKKASASGERDTDEKEEKEKGESKPDGKKDAGKSSEPDGDKDGDGK